MVIHVYVEKILASFLLMQKVSVPRSASPACSSGKQTEHWQGCTVSAACPQTSFLQADGALHGAAIYPHPAALGGPCSLHWYWYTARQTFPGVSHILPDPEGKAAPCQHSHTWKRCKASTRKKSWALWTNSWSTLSYSCSKIQEWVRNVPTSWIDWARIYILMQGLLAHSSYCVLKESTAIPFADT